MWVLGGMGQPRRGVWVGRHLSLSALTCGGLCCAQATGVYDQRFVTLTDQVKALGKAQTVAEELVALDVSTSARACSPAGVWWWGTGSHGLTFPPVHAAPEPNARLGGVRLHSGAKERAPPAVVHVVLRPGVHQPHLRAAPDHLLGPRT